MVAQFFNSHDNLCFFCSDMILRQWNSLLKIRAICQKHDPIKLAFPMNFHQSILYTKYTSLKALTLRLSFPLRISRTHNNFCNIWFQGKRIDCVRLYFSFGTVSVSRCYKSLTEMTNTKYVQTQQWINLQVNFVQIPWKNYRKKWKHYFLKDAFPLHFRIIVSPVINKPAQYHGREKRCSYCCSCYSNTLTSNLLQYVNLVYLAIKKLSSFALF